MWYFETETHVFLIQMARPGEYELWLNHRLLDSFSDPDAAAKSVLLGETGELTWDGQPHVEIPTGLEAWLPGVPEGYLPQ
jgi:hypothetical protein